MNKKELRILFLGTTSFAVEHLRFLIQEDYNVVGIVTTPDKPAGRGHKLQMSPVKEFALDLGIPILQPVKLRNEDFLNEIKELNPTLGIVIAFRMLPREVWQLPSLGTVNIHGSLLPRWRGAAPINHALIAGDETTGVTIFQLTEQLDEGNILGSRSIPLGKDDFFGAVHDQLALEGVELLRESLEHLLSKEAFPMEVKQPMDCSEPYAHKLTKENTRIDWRQSAREIHNLVRGLSPYPAAWTTIQDKNEMEISTYKIFETEVIDTIFALPNPEKKYKPGSIIAAPKGKIYVATGKGVLSIRSLQAPGKKRMDSSAFLNGNQHIKGSSFE